MYLSQKLSHNPASLVYIFGILTSFTTLPISYRPSIAVLFLVIAMYLLNHFKKESRMVSCYTLVYLREDRWEGRLKHTSTLIGEIKVEENRISDSGYYTNSSPIEVIN